VSMSGTSTSGESWDSVAVLAEPTRRRIYDVVRRSDAPMTREGVAAAVGITQRLAAFHLDRLAEAGLVAVDYARPPGRSGPGAGRPAKRYTPAPVELELALPPRQYNWVARILAAAIATRPKDADASAIELARAEGHRAGALRRPRRKPRGHAAIEAAQQTLSHLGYEPVEDDDQCVRLRNCPFHDVVDVAPGLVCSLNEQLVAGVLEGLGVDDRCAARLDGAPPDCCVTVRASRAASR
jgi:predicted ArsR family transcriptional regulator